MPIGRYSKRSTRKTQKRKIKMSPSFKKEKKPKVVDISLFIFWIGFLLSFWKWQFIIFPIGVMFNDIFAPYFGKEKEE